MTHIWTTITSGFLICLLASLPANATDIGTPNAKLLGNVIRERPYSPYAGNAVPTRIFWGDTHLHTGLSLDAGLFGNTLGLDEAYRFARGEEVTSSTGLPVKLSRPLDWWSSQITPT